MKGFWIISVAAVTAVSAFGQGTLVFANYARFFVDVPFFDSGGDRLSGTNYLAQLYVGRRPDTLWPVGTAVPFLTGTNAGYFTGGVTTIPNFPTGDSAWVQVRAWETGGGSSFEVAALAGHWSGVSSVVYVKDLGGPSGGVPAVPPYLTGLQYPGNPMFIRHPLDQKVRIGGAATLLVIASGGGPMVYQWYEGLSGETNALSAGATNTSFTTPSLSANATFWVSVQDSAGSTNSAAATVRVYPTNAVWLDAQMISGVVNLTVNGIVSATYRIDYSPEPGGTNWTTLTNVTLSANPFTFRDAESTNSVKRFYRAVTP